MISATQVKALAEEKVAGTNNYIVDVRVTTDNKIYVEVDNIERGVTIKECVGVSRAIEGAFDREEEDFELKVSSPGLDQPFKVHQQYLKNVGREVKVVKNDDRSQKGLLKTVNDDGIVLETKRKEKIEGRKAKQWVVEEHPIGFENIKETTVIISF